MKKRNRNKYGMVKESLFPPFLFVTYFIVLLLMSGVHIGLLVLAHRYDWNKVIQTVIPMVYWGAVAAGLTLYTRKQIKRTYEEPLHRLADATEKVANGDFSVYVPTLHTADNLDYLDVIILDFNKMVEELGSIETLKTDFVSNVSHEMKTPIAIIKNYAELLGMERITEEQRKEYAGTIEDAAKRMSDLIGNILKLNKLENQRIIPEAESYNVCGQLCESILHFEDAWDRKEIELEAEIEDRAMVRADESFLELVWNNILSNAIKFTEKGGKITVKQTSDEEYIRISVSDTGCGMDQTTLKHLFDKFYQGDTSHSHEGNGLGMALVKRVLELSDGDIQVFSEVGKGSTFVVTLPVENQSENKKESEE